MKRSAAAAVSPAAAVLGLFLTFGLIVASVLDSLVGVAFGAVGIALAMAASGPNIDALALVQLGEERMADYGRIRGWESLSYAAGCLAFGWLLDLYGVSLALPLYAAAGAIMLVWTTIAVRPDRPKERVQIGRASCRERVLDHV